MRLITIIKNSNFYLQVISALKPHIKQTHITTLNFYKQFIKPDDLCFDVGANIGDKVNFFNILGARTIAIEPDKEAFKILSAKNKHKKRVTLLNIGLGAEVKEKVLHYSTVKGLSTFDDDDVKSTVNDKRFKEAQFFSDATVQISTLDVLIKKYGLPKYCKISTVGYELEIIRGLSYPIDVISITCNLPHHIERTLECIYLINKLGNYKFNYFLSNLVNGFVSEEWLEYNQISKIISSLPEKVESRYIEVFAVKHQ